MSEGAASTFSTGIPGSPNRAWVALKDGTAIVKVFTHESGHRTYRTRDADAVYSSDSIGSSVALFPAGAR